MNNTYLPAPVGLTAMTETLAERGRRLWPAGAWGRVAGRQWYEEGALAAGALAGIPVAGMFPMARHLPVTTWEVVTLDTWVEGGGHHQEDKVVATFLREEEAAAFLEAGLQDGSLYEPFIRTGLERGIPPQAKCLRRIARHAEAARRFVRQAERAPAYAGWALKRAHEERTLAEAAASAEGYAAPAWEWLPQA